MDPTDNIISLALNHKYEHFIIRLYILSNTAVPVNLSFGLP